MYRDERKVLKWLLMLPSDPEMCGQSIGGESQIQLWLKKIVCWYKDVNWGEWGEESEGPRNPTQNKSTKPNLPLYKENLSPTLFHT